MEPTVAIIANPASGKDIRRLVAHATVTSDATKVSIVRRAVVGAIEGGARRFLLMPDRSGLAERALKGLDLGGAEVEFVDPAMTGDGRDTSVAAARFGDLGAGAVIVLGGDGTNRDAAKGWPSLPLIGVSTGTNNVFPRWVEGTVAGLAAGLVASDQVPLADVSRPAKIIHAEFADATTDLALVDLVLVEGRFTGSRALWEADLLRAAVVAVAEPDAVGVAAVAGAAMPCGRDEDGGVVVYFEAGKPGVRAALGPGLFAHVGVGAAERLPEHLTVELEGPGVLAFDGERDRVLGSRERATVRIVRDGPRVIDIGAALRAAAMGGAFQSQLD
ncbi:MAG: ATP-NAD kinase [Actinomycetia bacterium]|nr:ATP-NAD kinase [Actinomycetes bacterium]MCP3912718.1 ATP-NAD kinase [Actinomycetes bacterium]